MRSKHDKEYYDLIELIEKKFKAGEIPEEQKDYMINEATMKEIGRRRKDINGALAMFVIPTNDENDPTYYMHKINKCIYEEYILCKITLEEVILAQNAYLDYIEKYNKDNPNVEPKQSKRIYEDVMSGKLDLFNMTIENYKEKYGV